MQVDTLPRNATGRKFGEKIPRAISSFGNLSTRKTPEIGHMQGSGFRKINPFSKGAAVVPSLGTAVIYDGLDTDTSYR